MDARLGTKGWFDHHYAGVGFNDDLEVDEALEAAVVWAVGAFQDWRMAAQGRGDWEGVGDAK